MNDKTVDSLIEGVIAGDAAAAREFQKKYQAELESKLLAKCEASDGEAREEAREIAASVISLCCVPGVASLLSRYSHRCPFSAWLFLIAMRRMINYFNKRNKHTKVPMDGEESSDRNVPTALWTVEEAQDVISQLVQQALWHAMQQLKEQDPEALVWLRMVHLHNTEQQLLATLWDRDPGVISRRMKGASRLLRDETFAWLAATDPHLETNFADYVKAISLHMRLVHGDTEEEAVVHGLV